MEGAPVMFLFGGQDFNFSTPQVFHPLLATNFNKGPLGNQYSKTLTQSPCSAMKIKTTGQGGVTYIIVGTRY